jgi:hypothetical protein
LDGGGVLSFPNSFNVGRTFTFGSGGAGIHVAPGKTLSTDGDFNGPGEFRKTGAGTLKWNGDGTSTGAVYVEEGLLDYGTSKSVNNSSGLISVAAGARVNLNTSSGVYFVHDFVIAGFGPAGEGALSVSGSGKTTGSVTLGEDARIRANSGATFTFEGRFDGQGNNLDFGGSGRFGIPGTIDLASGNLILSGTPYLSIKTTAIVVCNSITIAAGSTLELNTANARASDATISGVLKGVQGRLASSGPVTIASGGSIGGGLLDGPGLFTVDGDLILSAGSICHSYLQGATGASSDGSGGLHGQILVTGSGTVGGTLKLVRDAAFTPKAGDEIFVMLRNAGSGTFNKVTVIDGTTSVDYSGAQHTQIIVGGVTGTLRYNRHSSINLSNPSSGADISIKF